MQVVADSKNAMEYLFSKNLSGYDKDRLQTKKELRTDLLEIIGSFVSEIEKGHWIKKMGELFRIPEKTLTDILKKLRLEGE